MGPTDWKMVVGNRVITLPMGGSQEETRAVLGGLGMWVGETARRGYEAGHSHPASWGIGSRRVRRTPEDCRPGGSFAFARVPGRGSICREGRAGRWSMDAIP